MHMFVCKSELKEVKRWYFTFKNDALHVCTYLCAYGDSSGLIKDRGAYG